MTKDRPRNRSGGGPRTPRLEAGKGPSAGRFADRRAPRAAPSTVADNATGDEAPWRSSRNEAGGPGGKPARPAEDRSPKETGGEGHSVKSFHKPKRRDGNQPRANDRDRQDAPASRTSFERRESAFQEGDDVWIWGLHAGCAALQNPRRRIRQALLTAGAAERLGIDPVSLPPNARLAEPRELDQRLPPGAVHQGVGVRAAPLDPVAISDFVALPDKPLVILDQVTDPQNVGAIFRSAAAFGFGGVVMQTRNAPMLGGALAKAAAGAVETVDEIREVNIARTIDALKEAGWRVVGLEGSAGETLEAAFATSQPLAVVLGAEGSGLRPLVATSCSRLARIAIGEGMESLNVSNAAAIAFYEVSRRNGAAPAPPRAAARGAEPGETD